MHDLEVVLADRVAQRVVDIVKPIVSQRRLLTESAAMELLDVASPKTMRKMRQEGLPAYQPTGRQYYYFSDDIEAWVKHKGRAV